MGDLKTYREKRDFQKTLEPEGELIPSEAKMRFVIQHHLARRDHYDLRLEWGGVLLSWAVPKGPSLSVKDKRLAVRVEDHPLSYRHFEGTIPKGQYGGGTVMLWDEGYWEPLGEVEAGLASGELKFHLYGKRVKGKWVLVRWQAQSDKDQDNWLLIKEKDTYVQETSNISFYQTSIRTGRNMAEIEAGAASKQVGNPFTTSSVQLATKADTIPRHGEWLYELKYDGYRIVAYVEDNEVRLMTRNGHDYATRFPTIAATLLGFAAGRAMILDGEMTHIDDSGKSDFQALQNEWKSSREPALTYIVFDLLALDGVDLRKQPLVKRKQRLADLMQGAPDSLYYSRHVTGEGKQSFAAACQAGMEGVIGKRADSPYSGGRSGDWIKLKCDNRQEFVIGGYTRSAVNTSGVSSLLLGVYEADKLMYAGRAGSGISEKEAARLIEMFEKLERETAAFAHAPKARANESITWLVPEMVAEIKFAEWTQEGVVRQASYKGIRTDKLPQEVVREAMGKEVFTEEVSNKSTSRLMVAGIGITNPDKIIYRDPQLTKAHVVRYYEQVAERMLPYVSGRILSVVRCPKGAVEACFYKKHPDKTNREIVTMPITTGSGKTELYFYVDKLSGLIAEAQMGTLEFHTWGSRIEALETPDIMVFDLDPDEGMALGDIRRGARDVRQIVEALSLKAYLKTSGGKGYHVVVPFRQGMGWDKFHEFAKQVAQVMEQKWPDRYTSNVRKASRSGKIFIDWIRNGRGATSIAPYSLRAREGAKVSMPITWEELEHVAPDGIDLNQALVRMADRDPWAGFFHK